MSEKNLKIIKGKFQNMTEQDIDSYMVQLAKTDGKDLDGYEKNAFNEIQMARQEQASIEKRINLLNRELEKLSSSRLIIQGRIDAYTEMLMKAEDERRNNK